MFSNEKQFFNEVKLSGKLVKDTEVKRNSDKFTKKTWNMAINTILHVDGSKDHRKFHYFDIVAFDEIAEKLFRLNKDEHVVITGRLSSNKYEDKISEKMITRVKIILEDIVSTESRKNVSGDKTEPFNIGNVGSILKSLNYSDAEIKFGIGVAIDQYGYTINNFEEMQRFLDCANKAAASKKDADSKVVSEKGTDSTEIQMPKDADSKVVSEKGTDSTEIQMPKDVDKNEEEVKEKNNVLDSDYIRSTLKKLGYCDDEVELGINAIRNNFHKDLEIGDDFVAYAIQQIANSKKETDGE